MIIIRAYFKEVVIQNIFLIGRVSKSEYSRAHGAGAGGDCGDWRHLSSVPYPRGFTKRRTFWQN